MLTWGTYRYQFNDRFSTQIAGGVLVYYVSAQPGKITAFKAVSDPATGARPTLTGPRASACSSATRWPARDRVPR